MNLYSECLEKDKKIKLQERYIQPVNPFNRHQLANISVPYISIGSILLDQILETHIGWMFTFQRIGNPG